MKGVLLIFLVGWTWRYLEELYLIRVDSANVHTVPSVPEAPSVEVADRHFKVSTGISGFSNFHPSLLLDDNNCSLNLSERYLRALF